MKNGFTPKEFAHSIAVDALKNAFENKFNELEGLPPAQANEARKQIQRLRTKLAEQANLDYQELPFPKEH